MSSNEVTVGQLQETTEANALNLPPAVTPEGVAGTKLRHWSSVNNLEEGRGYRIKPM